MATCPLICLLLVLLSTACLSEPSHVSNRTKWEMLEAITHGIHLDDELIVREKEYYAYYFWNMYTSSSRLERKKYVYEMSETLKQIAYRDCRLDMIGLILFGPEKSPSVLRTSPDYDRLEVGEDYYQCLETIAYFYTKHCGPIILDGLRHIGSMSNICLYAEEKAAIEDAIIVTCGLNNVAPPGIDMRNPKVDIEVIPAPLHGFSEHCGRFSINGISRMEIQSYAKSYEVIFDPLGSDDMLNKTQICFHRDASRGLCQCEKDDWRFIQRGPHGFFLSPYEQGFIDVKFDSGVYGYVTVSLKKDLRERWRYVILVVGVAVLIMAGGSDILNPNVVGDEDRAVTWTMRTFGAMAIFLSSYDTLLALVALAASLALNFVINFIR